MNASTLEGVNRARTATAVVPNLVSIIFEPRLEFCVPLAIACAGAICAAASRWLCLRCSSISPLKPRLSILTPDSPGRLCTPRGDHVGGRRVDFLAKASVPEPYAKLRSSDERRETFALLIRGRRDKPSLNHAPVLEGSTHHHHQSLASISSCDIYGRSGHTLSYLIFQYCRTPSRFRFLSLPGQKSQHPDQRLSDAHRPDGQSDVQSSIRRSLVLPNRSMDAYEISRRPSYIPDERRGLISQALLFIGLCIY